MFHKKNGVSRETLVASISNIQRGDMERDVVIVASALLSIYELALAGFDAPDAAEIERLRDDLGRLEAENALLREALPNSDEWLDGELALSVYAETTQTSRKPGWEWALRVRSVLARLDAARKGE